MKRTKTSDQFVEEEIAGGREFELTLRDNKVVFEMTFASAYAAAVAYHELAESAESGYIGLKLTVGRVAPAPTRRVSADWLRALLARWGKR